MHLGLLGGLSDGDCQKTEVCELWDLAYSTVSKRDDHLHVAVCTRVTVLFWWKI
jgi:hypothetical protein